MRKLRRGSRGTLGLLPLVWAKEEQTMSVSTTEQLAKTLSYIGNCVQYAESMRAQPNCNSCGRERCEYGPRLGRPIRINCPLWEEAEEEEKKEWKNADFSQTTKMLFYLGDCMRFTESMRKLPKCDSCEKKCEYRSEELTRINCPFWEE